MRPVDKTRFTQNEESYTPYGDAKTDLLSAIGAYCSYCERSGFSSALHIEHIKDKEDYPDDKEKWDNFLLACVNCNSIKGTKEVDESLAMPHIDNTYKLLKYDNGLVEVMSNLTVLEQSKANKLIELIGLDRVPSHPRYSNKDDRWNERREVEKLAKVFMSDYQSNDEKDRLLIELAKARGFWSIWMNYFKGYPHLQEELIESFNGTNKNYRYAEEDN